MRRRTWIGGLAVAALAAKTMKAAVPGGVRRGHLLTWDGQRVLLMGGYSIHHTPVEEEVWRLDAGGWKRMAGPAPPARVLTCGAFDDARRCVWMFGGLNARSNTNYGDLWKWDGARWQQIDVQSPGARDHHAAAFDSHRGRMVVYGGGTAGGRLMMDDFLEWDGARWTVIKKLDPGQRVHHAMTYDPVRKVTVLFGGFGSDSKYRGDTWLWDGATWTKAADTGPEPRARNRMAWDPKRGEVVLYGGDKGGGRTNFEILEDTWVWNGNSWRQKNVGEPGQSPGPRMMHAMCWDPHREGVILYGGRFAERDRDDAWRWNGESWGLMPA